MKMRHVFLLLLFAVVIFLHFYFPLNFPIKRDDLILKNQATAKSKLRRFDLGNFFKIFNDDGKIGSYSFKIELSYSEENQCEKEKILFQNKNDLRNLIEKSFEGYFSNTKLSPSELGYIHKEMKTKINGFINSRTQMKDIVESVFIPVIKFNF